MREKGEGDAQTVSRRWRRGSRGLVRHVVDGAEEFGNDEEWIRPRRWVAQVPAAFGPPPALTDDAVGREGRRGDGGGASRRPRANPRSVGTVGVGCGGGELRVPCPGPHSSSL